VCVCMCACGLLLGDKRGEKKCFRSLTLSSSPLPRQRYDVCRTATDLSTPLSQTLCNRADAVTPSRSLFLPSSPPHHIENRRRRRRRRRRIEFPLRRELTII